MQEWTRGKNQEAAWREASAQGAEVCPYRVMKKTIDKGKNSNMERYKMKSQKFSFKTLRRC